MKAGIREVVWGGLITLVSNQRALRAEAVAGDRTSTISKSLVHYKPTAVSDLSHSLIYVCDPKAAGEAPCAKQISENLARAPIRRPVSEADVTSLMRSMKSDARKETSIEGSRDLSPRFSRALSFSIARLREFR
jgi:hypothetical protein